MTHELLGGDKIDSQANKASGKRMAKIVEAAAWNLGSPQHASESGLGVFDGSSAPSECVVY